VVVHGLGLNITVQSYDQSLDFGLMADAAAMPDVRFLADAIAVAFDDVRALMGEGRDAEADEAGMVKSARKALGRALDTVVDRATGLMPAQMGRVARAVNRRTVKAATVMAADIVPALAQKAMEDAVSRLSGLAGKSVGLVRKAAPRGRATARR
jgi:hypothetical protein